jgi:hypothetical protein
MTGQERALAMLLRLTAVTEFFALAGVFMPQSWMAAFHERLGLGAFPDGVTAAYLARNLSAFYALQGGMLWVAARDVKRHAAIVDYFAWTGLAFAGLITVLDILAGFPWYWMVAEGPGLAVLCVAIAILRRGMARAGPTGDAASRLRG